MFFWIICVLLAAVVGVMVAAPLWRPAAAPAASPNVAFYRSQLVELDRDITRGVIAPAEAKIARVEIARRLLAADSEVSVGQTDRASPVIAAIVVAVIAAVGVSAYNYLGAPGYGDLPLKARIAASDEIRENRPTQAAMTAAAPPPAVVDVPADYLASVVQLRQIVPTRPDNVDGWALLATLQKPRRPLARFRSRLPFHLKRHTHGSTAPSLPLDRRRLLSARTTPPPCYGSCYRDQRH